MINDNEKQVLVNKLAILKFSQDEALKDKLLLRLAELDLKEKLVSQKKL